mgnify:CR=1 FL=1|nr:carbohydrate kinase family protein [uncultured Dongia sp.]
MTKARRGIVTGGMWCVDRNRTIDAWPHEDGVAEISGIEIYGGGSACNMALDLKKLDPSFPVETIGLVGDDDDGRFLLAQADAHGIDRTQLIAVEGAETQFTDAYVSKTTGRRTHIFYQGASALLTPDHFDLVRTTGRILHLGLPGAHRKMDAPWRDDPNGWVTVLRQARAVGLETNLELFSIAPDRIATMIRPCLPHLDYLIVNDLEIGAIAGKETSHDGVAVVTACVEAARQVLAQGAMGLVVVHFPAGAVAIARDGQIWTASSVSIPQAEIVSANGAGDAFAAGAIYALHEGWSVDAALELAHATAAMSLRGLSTCAAVDTYQACLAQAKRWGHRPAI